MSEYPYSKHWKIATVMVFVLGIYEMIRYETISMSGLLKFPKLRTSLLPLILLATPNMFYIYIWNCPESYKRLVAKISDLHPCDFLLKYVKIGKFIQLIAFFGWYYISIETSVINRIIEIFTLKSISFIQMLCGIYLYTVGKILYFAVWKQLGIDGACYGFKFGRPIKWKTGFPFNLGLRHPQYTSFVLSLYGVTFILIDKASAENGMLMFTTIFGSYNIFTALSEQLSDQDALKKK